jgi:hypothetical protein
MNRALLALLAVLSLVVSGDALACQSDADCQEGFKCSKARGSFYGSCVGGLAPENETDRKPVRDPLDGADGSRAGCSFDSDCGPRGRCLKGSGIRGSCL